MRWTLLASCLMLLAASLPVLAQSPDQPAAARRVLLDDDFDDPDTGWLPRSSPSPTRYLRGYDDGEYFIQKVDPEFGLPLVAIPGSYSDTTLAIDVRLVGDTEGRYVAVDCRIGSGGRYRAVIDPDQGRFWLQRHDGNQMTLLTLRTPANAIARANATNHVELTCAGSLLSLSINGTQVGSARDTAYSEGGHSIGADAFIETPNMAEARFDNLVVYEAAVPPTATPVPTPTPGPTSTPAPTAVPRAILSDNFNDPATGWLPSSSPQPASYALEYVDGEYAVRLVDLNYGFVAVAAVPGIYRDTSLAVDVRLIGDTLRRYVVLTCRDSPSGQYRLSLYPATRSMLFMRWDGGDNWVTLGEGPVEAIRRDNATNRVELRCVGSTIAAIINGNLVASAEDAAYREGLTWIGVGTSMLGLAAEARFDNLVLTQH